VSTSLEKIIQIAALEAVEAYKEAERHRQHLRKHGAPGSEERIFRNEYQREWRRIRIEVDPAYRAIERAKFVKRYRESPDAWRKARVEREKARQKTAPALEYQRAYRSKWRAGNPERVERERARDRARYLKKKEQENA